MGIGESVKEFVLAAAEQFADGARDVLTLTDLKKHLLAGDMLAFVGAGLSRRAGYPTWTQLLEKLSEAANDAPLTGSRTVRQKTLASLKEEEKEDLLWQAEWYRSVLPKEQYLATLERIFAAPARPDRCLDLIVRLPFRHILTTNYDRALEEAHRRVRPKEPFHLVNWSDDEQVRELLVRFRDDGFERRYICLHGHIARPETIVLSDGDYVRQYMQTDATMRRLFSIFAMNRVLFVGCSLNDPELNLILRQVAAGSSANALKHFALAGVRPEHKVIYRRRFTRKFGIQPVLYDDKDDHAALVDLVDTLRRKPGKRRSSPGGSRKRRTTGVATAGAARPRKAGATAKFVTADRGTFKAPQRPPHPDDPRKGLFGGSAERDGLTLSADVHPSKDSSSWFDVALKVARSNGAPLKGKVTFYLHDTFHPDEVTIETDGREARHEVQSYGAFTVGAIVRPGGTRLELDLAGLESAPRKFRNS